MTQHVVNSWCMSIASAVNAHGSCSMTHPLPILAPSFLLSAALVSLFAQPLACNAWGTAPAAAPLEPIFGDPRDNPQCANFYETYRVPYGGFHSAKGPLVRFELEPHHISTNIVTRQYLDFISLNETDARNQPHWFRVVKDRSSRADTVALFLRNPKASSTVVTGSIKASEGMDIGGYLTTSAISHLPSKKKRFKDTLLVRT